MDWKWYYTSLDGRIGRKQFWIGAILLSIAGIIIGYIISSIFGVGMMNVAALATGTTSPEEIMAMTTKSAWANLITFLIIAYPAAAMMIKRRHDRGNSGMDIWIYLALSLLMILIQAVGIGYAMTDIGNGITMPMPAIWFSVVGALIAIFAIYLLVVLGFLKGNEGENAYGPNPLTAS